MKDIDFSIFNKLDCERQFQKVNFLPYKNICKLIEENKLTIGEDNSWYLEV